jgi:hypothetical protein
MLFRLIVVLSIGILISACDGGGGSSISPPNNPTYTLSGQVQKGPFAIGSQISVNELNERLSPTGKVYNVQTKDDLGNFAVNSPIGTHLVEIIGNGFYMDELTGQLASTAISLRAVTDLSINTNPTVNILTSLQGSRLKVLVAQGSSYAAADTQSRNEVLLAFGIDPTKVNSLSTLYSMQISGSADSDSVLLAISAILSKMATTAAIANGSSQPAELSNYVNTISAQLASTGTLSNTTILAAWTLAASQLDLVAVRKNIQTYYATKGVSLTAPKFEEWVDKSGSGVLPIRLVATTGLTLTDAAGVGSQQIITSNTITVSGLGTGISAPVTSDFTTTIVKNGTDTGTVTTAVDGDTIALRVTSLGYGMTSTSTITVGTSTATWNVTTTPLSGSFRMLIGTGLILQNNGGDNLTIPAGSTTFNFALPVTLGSGYNVTVLTQPTTPAQICTVANGAGTVGSTPSNIIVSCAGPVTGLGYTNVTGVNPNQAITSNAYTVSGLGSGIVTSVTVNASATIIQNGTPVVGTTTSAVDGDTIALRITSLGYGLTNTSTITIASSSTSWLVTSKPLGGTANSLTGTGLILQNNGGDNLTIPAGSTTFNFALPVTLGSGYNVTVLTQPTTPAQICTVANGVGTVDSTPSNIIVSCASYTLVANSIIGLLAAEGDSVLYKASDTSIRLRNTSANTEVTLTNATTIAHTTDWQISGGRVYVQGKGADCGRSCIYQWQANGSITNLSTRGENPVSHAEYVLWLDGFGYILYNLTNDSYTQIAKPISINHNGNTNYDFAVVSGNVIFDYWGRTGGSGTSSTFDIYQWSSATQISTRLTNNGQQNIYTQTDGTWAAWIERAILDANQSLIYQSVSGTTPFTVSTTMTNFILSSGVLAWREGTGTIKALSISSSTTNTLATQGVLYSNDGGFVMHGLSGQTYSFNTATGISNLSIVIAPSQIIQTGNVVYFSFGQVLYKIILN